MREEREQEREKEVALAKLSQACAEIEVRIDPYRSVSIRIDPYRSV